jgi:hypothetical protein
VIDRADHGMYQRRRASRATDREHHNRTALPRDAPPNC